MFKRIGIPFAVIVALSAGIFIATQSMIKPMSADLSVVGQGRPSLVLGFESYSPTGGDALNRLNLIRGDYEDRMVFVVADLGTPQGQAFARQHNLRDGVAIFVSPDGKPGKIDTIPADEKLLRRQLDSKLARIGR
tara:strand:- start:888 stop:1292 length:405 start_codon:yes stop_codon:yes gene_type:complete